MRALSLASALALFAGMSLAGGPAPVGAQAIVGLEKSPKPVMTEWDGALARLRDGWSAATLTAGETAGPATTAEALVRMIQEPIKILGHAGASGAEMQRLKSALREVETRVRAVAQALEQGRLSRDAAPAEVQRALDAYLAVLSVRPEFGTPVPAGADRR